MAKLEADVRAWFIGLRARRKQNNIVLITGNDVDPWNENGWAYNTMTIRIGTLSLGRCLLHVVLRRQRETRGCCGGGRRVIMCTHAKRCFRAGRVVRSSRSERSLVRVWPIKGIITVRRYYVVGLQDIMIHHRTSSGVRTSVYLSLWRSNTKLCQQCFFQLRIKCTQTFVFFNVI